MSQHLYTFHWFHGPSLTSGFQPASPRNPSIASSGCTPALAIYGRKSQEKLSLMPTCWPLSLLGCVTMLLLSFCAVRSRDFQNNFSLKRGIPGNAPEMRNVYYTSANMCSLWPHPAAHIGTHPPCRLEGHTGPSRPWLPAPFPAMKHTLAHPWLLSQSLSPGGYCLLFLLTDRLLRTPVLYNGVLLHSHGPSEAWPYLASSADTPNKQWSLSLFKS